MVSAAATDFTYTNYNVTADTTGPTAPAISFGGYTSGTWTTQNISFTLSGGSDGTGSGIQKLQYKISSAGTWTNYSTAVTISTEGETTIYARAVDNAGNVTPDAQAATATAKIDKTAPAVTFNPNGGTFNGDASISITCVDSVSGVASSKYIWAASSTPPADTNSKR